MLFVGLHQNLQSNHENVCHDLILVSTQNNSESCTLNFLYHKLRISSNHNLSHLCLVVWYFDEWHRHTHTYTLWVPDASANMHHFGCKAQKVENPVLLSGLDLLNKAKSSFELHRMSFLNILFVRNTHEIFFS